MDLPRNLHEAMRPQTEIEMPVIRGAALRPKSETFSRRFQLFPDGSRQLGKCLKSSCNTGKECGSRQMAGSGIPFLFFRRIPDREQRLNGKGRKNGKS